MKNFKTQLENRSHAMQGCSILKRLAERSMSRSLRIKSKIKNRVTENALSAKGILYCRGSLILD